jgi:beta-lactamase class A
MSRALAVSAGWAAAEPMGAGVEDLFEQAGCTGQLCVQSLDGTQELAVDADRPAVSASVVKVPVALEAEKQFAEGRLDPRERVTLAAADRAPGPTGFSLFQDDVGVSLRDLTVAMLTISDNAATDALLGRIGIDAVNAACVRLGLAGTVVAADLRTIVNSIGRDAGFRDWDTMVAWAAQPHAKDDEDQMSRRVAAASALIPARTTRTTPRDMATLLRLIWSGQAGPQRACQRVRQIMHRQLTRHRLAAAFPPPARVAAKSGSLVGVVRNEIGVVEYPDGRGYAAAVFTQAHRPWRGDAAINAAIGAAAAAAVSQLGAGAG